MLLLILYRILFCHFNSCQSENLFDNQYEQNSEFLRKGL
ncbi:hypothetical protein pb186bvf_004668 [Paramecium bursaria]